jgi:hypothetical protein
LLFSDHEKAEWKRRYATQLSPSIRKGFLVAGLLSKLNGKNSNLQVATIQQRRFYSVAFPRKSCRAEKSRTIPKKGINTHPAFASGTAETGGASFLTFPFCLPLFWPLLPWPLSVPANASTGRIKVAADKAHTLRR